MTSEKGNQTISLGNIARLSLNDFRTMATLIYNQCGIHLPESKKIMLESRLSRRLRAAGFDGFAEYIKFLQTPEGLDKELIQMIDVVTTNKTDFFREPHHFDYLRSTILPEHCAKFMTRPFQVWSAACSSGEEPYTLAMVLSDMGSIESRFTYSIIASDISTQVLEKASTAVYPVERVATLPLAIKQRFFLKSKNSDRPTVRVIGSLREKVQFKRINLMDHTLKVDDGLDAIFCRNVLIYFDRKTQFEVVSKLIRKLRPGGYLFIGHSESLHQLDLPLHQCKPTIFQKL